MQYQPKCRCTEIPSVGWHLAGTGEFTPCSSCSMRNTLVEGISERNSKWNGSWAPCLGGLSCVPAPQLWTLHQTLGQTAKSEKPFYKSPGFPLLSIKLYKWCKISELKNDCLHHHNLLANVSQILVLQENLKLSLQKCVKCDENLVLLCYRPSSFSSCLFSNYFLRKIKKKKSFNGQLVIASSYLIFTRMFSTVTLLPFNSPSKDCQALTPPEPGSKAQKMPFCAGSFAFQLTGSSLAAFVPSSRRTQTSVPPTRAQLLPSSQLWETGTKAVTVKIISIISHQLLWFYTFFSTNFNW